MDERLICLACLVIGYGFGLLQIAHIYSKAKNVNIREKGSGNAGTTNMFRVMGIRAGIITLVGDCAKCVAAVILTRLIFITGMHFNIDPTALALYTGFGCVLGHDFPFYFHFKGGKGMATTAALICCLGSWQMIVIGVVIFFSTVIITKYVSLGSMLTVSASAVEFIIFTIVGWIKVDVSWLADCYVIFIILALLLLYQHRKNIARLKEHKETKFFFRTSKQIEEAETAHRKEQLEAKVEYVQQRTEKKVDKLQSKTERKVEKVQNKAAYKEKKAQIKAEYKQEMNKNWAGKIADHAPQSFKQKENPDDAE